MIEISTAGTFAIRGGHYEHNARRACSNGAKHGLSEYIILQLDDCI